MSPSQLELLSATIEKLEAEIERLRTERDNAIRHGVAEIERLRVERDTISKPLHAEIERLTEERDELFLANGKLANEMTAECLRLRDALQRIADGDKDTNNDLMEIARAALEGDEALFPTKNFGSWISDPMIYKICPECGQPMREGGYCDHIPF